MYILTILKQIKSFFTGQNTCKIGLGGRVHSGARQRLQQPCCIGFRVAVAVLGIVVAVLGVVVAVLGIEVACRVIVARRVVVAVLGVVVAVLGVVVAVDELGVGDGWRVVGLVTTLLGRKKAQGLRT